MVYEYEKYNFVSDNIVFTAISLLFCRMCHFTSWLARTSSSLKKLKNELTEANYYVVNIDYPSRDMQIKELAELSVNKDLAKCNKAKANPINFVTHSLGGILVPQYFIKHQQNGD